MKGKDSDELLQNVAECLGGLGLLLSSDVELKGDITGRDRFIIHQVDSCLNAVERVQELLDRQSMA